MNKIALFIGSSIPVYWHTIIIMLGIASSVFMLVALFLLHGRKIASLLLAIPLSMVFSLLFGRLVHWYCFPEKYDSFVTAMTVFHSGSFSLLGVFPGTLLTFTLLRSIHLINDLSGSLDDLSISGSLGIAVGRLSEYFGSADRGKFLFENQNLHHLPWSSAVINEVSGIVEWRFATFFFQSIWAALIFVFLATRIILLDRMPADSFKNKSGTGFVYFLILYCAGQILFDSTRYDAMFFRTNGFVSLEQIICCIIITSTFIFISIRSINNSGFKVFYPLCLIIYISGLILAGYMEYFVQRHGDRYLFSYSLMAVGLLLMIISIILLPQVKREN